MISFVHSSNLNLFKKLSHIRLKNEGQHVLKYLTLTNLIKYFFYFIDIFYIFLYFILYYLEHTY